MHRWAGFQSAQCAHILVCKCKAIYLPGCTNIWALFYCLYLSLIYLSVWALFLADYILMWELGLSIVMLNFVLKCVRKWNTLFLEKPFIRLQICKGNISTMWMRHVNKLDVNIIYLILDLLSVTFFIADQMLIAW